MLFWNNDYSRGLAGHMRPVTSVVQPASACAAGCVIQMQQSKKTTDRKSKN